MQHFAIALCAGVVATVAVGGTALTPTPAEAARTPSAEAVLYHLHHLVRSRGERIYAAVICPLGSKADMCSAVTPCPLRANSGHRHPRKLLANYPAAR
jgi:hypothetical protein